MPRELLSKLASFIQKKSKKWKTKRQSKQHKKGKSAQKVTIGELEYGTSYALTECVIVLLPSNFQQETQEVPDCRAAVGDLSFRNATLQSEKEQVGGPNDDNDQVKQQWLHRGNDIGYIARQDDVDQKCFDPLRNGRKGIDLKGSYKKEAELKRMSRKDNEDDTESLDKKKLLANRQLHPDKMTLDDWKENWGELTETTMAKLQKVFEGEETCPYNSSDSKCMQTFLGSASNLNLSRSAKGKTDDILDIAQLKASALPLRCNEGFPINTDAVQTISVPSNHPQQTEQVASANYTYNVKEEGDEVEIEVPQTGLLVNCYTELLRIAAVAATMVLSLFLQLAATMLTRQKASNVLPDYITSYTISQVRNDAPAETTPDSYYWKKMASVLTELKTMFVGEMDGIQHSTCETTPSLDELSALLDDNCKPKKYQICDTTLPVCFVAMDCSTTGYHSPDIGAQKWTLATQHLQADQLLAWIACRNPLDSIEYEEPLTLDCSDFIYIFSLKDGRFTPSTHFTLPRMNAVNKLESSHDRKLSSGRNCTSPNTCSSGDGGNGGDGRRSSDGKQSLSEQNNGDSEEQDYQQSDDELPIDGDNVGENSEDRDTNDGQGSGRSRDEGSGDASSEDGGERSDNIEDGNRSEDEDQQSGNRKSDDSRDGGSGGNREGGEKRPEKTNNVHENQSHESTGSVRRSYISQSKVNRPTDSGISAKWHHINPAPPGQTPHHVNHQTQNNQNLQKKTKSAEQQIILTVDDPGGGDSTELTAGGSEDLDTVPHFRTDPEKCSMEKRSKSALRGTVVEHFLAYILPQGWIDLAILQRILIYVYMVQPEEDQLPVQEEGNGDGQPPIEPIEAQDNQDEAEQEEDAQAEIDAQHPYDGGNRPEN